MKILFLTVSILLLTGCTFVKVSDQGAGVAQAVNADVVNCEALGEIESQTKDRVLLRRNQRSVAQELIDLARNQAANMGANAIVPVGEPVAVRQTFNAYLCR